MRGRISQLSYYLGPVCAIAFFVVVMALLLTNGADAPTFGGGLSGGAGASWFW